MNSTTAKAHRRATPCGRYGRPWPRPGCCSPSCDRCDPRRPEKPAFRRRAGQDVMTVRCKAHARNDLAPLSQRRVHAKLVIVAVQIIDVLSADFALEILPRAVANAVTRIDRRLAVGSLGAQIGVPGFSSRAVALCQFLTMPVRAFKTAEIGALAGPDAGDKERHVRRLWHVRTRLLQLL